MIAIMIYDMLMQTIFVRDFKSSGAMQNYFHHLLVIYGCSSGIIFGRYWLVLSNTALMTELSTPFVNLRYLLHTHKKSNTTIYIVNGLVMTGCFFLVRPLALGLAIFCVIPTMVGETDISRDSLHSQIGSTIATFCFALLWFLNLFWFRKMFMGAIKVLTGGGDKKKTAETPKNK